MLWLSEATNGRRPPVRRATAAQRRTAESPATAGCTTSREETPKGGTVKGGAGGAAGGAVIGGVAGDAGKGAAIGATAGGIAGRRAQKKAEKASQQQAARQTAQAQQQAQAQATVERNLWTLSRGLSLRVWTLGDIQSNSLVSTLRWLA